MNLLALHTCTHTNLDTHMHVYALHHPACAFRVVWSPLKLSSAPPRPFMSEPQFGEMSLSTMSWQGRALCHHSRGRYKHNSSTRHLKAPERKRERDRRETKDGERSQGVTLGNTLAAYQSQVLGLLPLLPWQHGTVRHPGGGDGPKNLQLSLTPGEREREREIKPLCERECVYSVLLLYHFTS